ncbi:MAG: sugar-binding transcriptional regulator [Clostridiales bacterium]|nr:sugar-binding transcriptional regulator [Clostridiales bacterium]
MIENNYNLENLDIIVPETKEMFLRRYQLLKLVEVYGPIGRRNLSAKSNISERQVRNDADFLKEKGMLNYFSEGMMISDKGIDLLDNLDEFTNHYHGFYDLKKVILEKLGIKNITIVDSRDNDFNATLNYMGIEGAKLLSESLKIGDVIGLTGGTSIRSLVDNYTNRNRKIGGVVVVPARGGLGQSTKYQANTLVENLASKMDAQYMNLYTPDFLSSKSIKYLKEEPNIKKTIETIEKINILAFGIGKADVMAKRRDLSGKQYDEIMSAGAVSEAFGCYFNSKGEMVHEISTIGITLEHFKKLKNLLAIAGGKDKANAIISVSNINKNLVLITDFDCATEIIKILRR